MTPLLLVNMIAGCFSGFVIVVVGVVVVVVCGIEVELDAVVEGVVVLVDSTPFIIGNNKLIKDGSSAGFFVVEDDCEPPMVCEDSMVRPRESVDHVNDANRLDCSSIGGNERDLYVYK